MASMRTSTPWANWKVGAFVAVLAATLVAACGNSAAPPVEGQGSIVQPDGSLLCSTGHPQPGCPCATSGATSPCGEVKGNNGGYATCQMGTTTCTNGSWSSCTGLTTMFKSLGPIGVHGPLGSAGARQPDALGMDSDGGDAGDAGQTQCTPYNFCDPTCTTFVDNSFGVDGGPGLVPTDAGGWTLFGEGGNLPEAATQCFVTLTGTVYDPAALEPVFNATVAIPYAGNPVGSGTPPAIGTGVPLTSACGGSQFAALRAATTAVDGTFTLAGVPVQQAVTVVVQIGRWRRVVQVNTSTCACGATIDISQPSTNTCLGTIGTCAGANNYAGTDACYTRLPRTQKGATGADNIPATAIATGGLDAIECMFYRMGVNSSEFTDETGPGRINIFNDGGSVLPAPNANHDLSWLLGFTCPGAQCPPGSYTTTNIVNPDFETGDLTGWTPAGTVAASQTQFYSGAWSALLGDPNNTGTGLSTLSQTFTAPPGATKLVFYAYTNCSQNSTVDYFGATLADNTSGQTVTFWGNHAKGCPSTAAWAKFVASNIVPGDTYTLTFEDYDGDSHTSYAYVDDVFWSPQLAQSLVYNYDMIVLPCDGGGEYNSANWGSGYDDPGRDELVYYANLGGRIFTSHWGREWIERQSAAGGLFPNGPFPGVATWIPDNGGGPTATGVINSGSAWGTNFNAWMTAVGAATGGVFTISPWREDTSAVSASSRLFVSYDGTNGTTAGYPADFTFDTPVGGSALGRVMYTDMHLANGTPSGTFPGNCPVQGTTLTNQEAAAEYLLFDLGNCVMGQPVPPNYPPIDTTGTGTNSTCTGGSAGDNQIEPASCTTDADCEMDFHCGGGTCIWSSGSGYYNTACLDDSGNPAIDLTIGAPCSNTGTTYDIPICNRGGATLPAGSVITIENSGGIGGTPSAPWSCAPPPTPNPPNVSGGAATCAYTTPMALGPGECMDIDTSTAAGAACQVLETGEQYLYINYDQSIPECGTGFVGTGPGCMNNTSHTKTTGIGCPALCGNAITYQPATFTRDFQGVCPTGYRVVWTWFSWSGVTPLDSSLDFQAWTADSQAQLGVQYTKSATLEQPAPDNHANGYTDNTMYGCQNCTDPTYVDVRLAAAGYPTSGSNASPPPASFASHSWLRVNMNLNPSSSLNYTPTLASWNQQYDCVPAE
jgi:hypothetical protein